MTPRSSTGISLPTTGVATLTEQSTLPVDPGKKSPASIAVLSLMRESPSHAWQELAGIRTTSQQPHPHLIFIPGSHTRCQIPLWSRLLLLQVGSVATTPSQQPTPAAATPTQSSLQAQGTGRAAGGPSAPAQAHSPISRELGFISEEKLQEFLLQRPAPAKKEAIPRTYPSAPSK